MKNSYTKLQLSVAEFICNIEEISCRITKHEFVDYIVLNIGEPNNSNLDYMIYIFTDCVLIQNLNLSIRKEYSYHTPETIQNLLKKIKECEQQARLKSLVTKIPWWSHERVDHPYKQHTNQ